MEQDTRLPLSDRIGALEAQGHALGDRVYESISGAIVEGRLAPGERVSDKELAEALGVSRTPVREALQRLSWAGLIEMSPSRYTRVTEVTEEMIASTLEYTGLQAGIALQLAVRRMDDAELAEAIAQLDRMIEASDAEDAADLMFASRIFVGYLTRLSGNPVLGKVMHEASLLAERNLRQARPVLGTREFRGDCYRKMRLSMLARDADAAERWFRAQHGIAATGLMSS
ncbi:GntR family transcriptional regulator [Microbacterium sp. A84]|uniref:GntR family transcriptional regulator n=1 Tax=Microbacterium sp. A84 TaxID=3450715 RepID=UPI003F43352E